MSVGSELYDWGDPDGLHGHLIIDDYAQHSFMGDGPGCIVGADDPFTMTNADPSLPPDVPSSGPIQSMGDWYHEHSSLLMLSFGAVVGYIILYAVSNAARAIR